MDNLSAALAAVLRQSDPSSLAALHEALLLRPAARESERGQVDQALEALGRFAGYLDQVRAKTTAREYSEVASLLDLGALGIVAFNRLLASEGGGLAALVSGALAEGLMVAASRQYVKAWDREAELINQQAIWYLREALWRVSEESQPDLDPAERAQMIRGLLAKTSQEALPPAARVVAIGRIFQVLLLIRVRPLLPTGEG